MKIDNSNLKLAVATEIIKKSQEVVKNEIGDILKKSMENSKAVEEAAKFTGTGNNLDIRA